MNSAAVLIGPTGAGKTPLGETLERKGLLGRRCFHFDFGRQLRSIADGKRRVSGLSPADVDFIRRALETGALLEAEQFRIAEAILADFIAGCNIRQDDLLLLNGLPRHVRQAERIDRLVRVELVVHLSCPAQVVIHRIRSNAGGDRGGREDDAIEAVQRRLATFDERTSLLLDYYRAKGAAVRTLAVGADSSPEDLLRDLGHIGK